MMRRQVAGLVTSACAASSRSFVGDRGGGGDNFFGGQSNFDEMMSKLKKGTSSNQQSVRRGASSAAAGGAALPSGLAQRQQKAAAASQQQQQQRRPQQQHQQQYQMNEKADDDDMSFEEMFAEGQRLGPVPPAPATAATASSSAPLQRHGAKAKENNDDDDDEMYARELRHAEQLRAEHRRADHLRQRGAATEAGVAFGAGTGGASSAMVGGGSVSFGDRAGRLRGLDYFSEEKKSSFQKPQRQAAFSGEDGSAADDLLFPESYASSSSSPSGDVHPQPLSQLKREKPARRSFAEIDDDDDEMAMHLANATAHTGSSSSSSSAVAAASSEDSLAAAPSLEELTALANEMTLLDDTNFAYFAPAAVGTTDIASVAAAGAKGKGDEDGSMRAQPMAAQQHVPGAPIVPPGFTRYRCDVQFQGGDFDGWDKSTEKMRHLLFDTSGSGYGAASSSSSGSPSASPSAAGNVARASATPLVDVLGLRPRARKVLEDALAVALDLSSVTVHAAVLPETGAHVRRLVCHVDIPSSVMMQPRTVLQRATTWLEQRAAGGKKGHQPLAILSFYPCPDQAFDARYSTYKRVYCYRILNRIAPPLFDAGLQWHVDQHLDVGRMNRFAALMQGTQDYGCFADPRLGHSLRKALQYSAPTMGGAGGMGGGAFGGSSSSARGSGNRLAMRFFAADSSQGNAAKAVSDLVEGSRLRVLDETLSRRHTGYVGEDLLAEEAGSSSAVAMRQYVKDTSSDGGPSVTNPRHKHHARKDEFKEWSPYEEQDPRALRRAAERAESLIVDYSPVTTRTIERLQVVRQDDEVLIWFVGKSFLRHQIRNMTAVLKAAGQGLWDERELKAFMKKGFSPQRSEARNRFPIAPVHGLTLWDTEQERRHSDPRYRNTDAGRTHEL